MILPNKHSKLSSSIIGVGATVLNYLDTSTTVSSLWYQVRELLEIYSFEKFTLTLDFLYTIGAIEFSEGLLRRTKNDLLYKS